MVGLRTNLCVLVRVRGGPLLTFAHCHSGAYNNAGLVSVGGVITANVPPPPYNSAHKVAGMIRAARETACVYEATHSLISELAA